MMFENCQLAKAVCDRFPNESVNANIWILMHNISHILMYKCIHKPMYHTQTPKIPRSFTYELVWQFSNYHIQMFAKLVKHLEKSLMLINRKCFCTFTIPLRCCTVLNTFCVDIGFNFEAHDENLKCWAWKINERFSTNKCNFITLLICYNYL